MPRDLAELAHAVETARPKGQPTPAEEAKYANALIDFAAELQRRTIFEDGADASIEAMQILERHVQAGQQEQLVPLAAALLIHANCLNGLESPRALGVYESAVRLYGQLGRREPERFAAQFGCACNDLAWALQRQGRAADALEHAERAVGLLNHVLERDRVGLHVLASAQVNLAYVLSALGRHQDALAATREAVTMYEFLAKDHPRAFAPLHVEILDYLRQALIEVGQFGQALGVADQAAKLAAELSREDPVRFLPLVARMGINVARCHFLVGRPRDAVPWALNSVKLHGILVDTDRDRYIEPAVRARTTLVTIFAKLGQIDEAMEQAIEGLRDIEPSWRAEPDEFDELARELAVAIMDFAEVSDTEVPDDVIALLEELAT